MHQDMQLPCTGGTFTSTGSALIVINLVSCRGSGDNVDVETPMTTLIGKELYAPTYGVNLTETETKTKCVLLSLLVAHCLSSLLESATPLGNLMGAVRTSSLVLAVE